MGLEPESGPAFHNPEARPLGLQLFHDLDAENTHLTEVWGGEEPVKRQCLLNCLFLNQQQCQNGEQWLLPGSLVPPVLLTGWTKIFHLKASTSFIIPLVMEASKSTGACG